MRDVEDRVQEKKIEGEVVPDLNHWTIINKKVTLVIEVTPGAEAKKGILDEKGIHTKVKANVIKSHELPKDVTKTDPAALQIQTGAQKVEEDPDLIPDIKILRPK